MRRIFGMALWVVALAASGMAQNNAIPLVYQPLIPASVAPGGKAFTLTVNGSGFSSGAVVNWNGSPRLTEVISANQMKATISASDVATAKTGWVTVTNPAPGGGTSNVVFLPVTSPRPAIAMAISQPFPGATFVSVGDFNNDGKLDVGWYDGSSFNVSLGNGKGGFSTPVKNTNIAGTDFVVGDFNGDGKLDVATAYVAQVYLWLGNGDGTFTEAWQYVPPFSGKYIAAADFGLSGAISFYHGRWDLGQQWFEFISNGNPGVQNFTSYFPGTASVGDFNGDGTLDLAIPEAGGGVTHILLNSGPQAYNDVGTVPLGSPTIVADMNQDGKLDLVDGCISLGGGDGTFTRSGCPPNIGPYSASTPAVGVGDFNGDGKLDIVNATDPAGVEVDLGAGDGTFQSGFVFPLPKSGFSLGAVGDFNNDGKLDVVTSNGYLLIQTTVDLTPFSLAFGNQNVGTTSAVQTATLTNVAASTLAITKISIVGTAASQFKQTNDCGTSLAAQSSCTVSVTFAPTKGGALAAALTVSYQGTASPQKVALTGRGIMPPSATLTPSRLKFATQLVGTKSVAQSAFLTNTGDVAVTITNIAATGAFSQTNNCPSSLAVGSSCTLEVLFQPTAAGAATGTLSITDNVANSPQKVALSGVGTVITVSPLSVNFGDQKVGTKSATAPVTFTNVGASAVAITQIGFTGTDPGDFSQTNNCGKTLAGKSSCTVNLTFKPAATGARSAALNITDNGGGSPQTVGLSGTGT